MHPDRRATLAAPGHPLVLASAALILVNDFVLRGAAPGWLTGKLSDVGWLVVAPVLVAGILAAVGVRRARGAGIVIAGAFYVALQLWPPLGAWVNPAHVADAADLLVLPAILGAFVAWRSAVRPRVWALPLLAATLVADDWGIGGTPASWPCGDDDMTWPVDDPLRIVFSDTPAIGTDTFARGIRLVEDASGAEVPLVFAQDARLVLVCARDGLRGDTAYTWTIGPWPDTSNEVAGPGDVFPTVRFRTTTGTGAAATVTSCAERGAYLAAEVDELCYTGEYRDPEPGESAG